MTLPSSVSPVAPLTIKVCRVSRPFSPLLRLSCPFPKTRLMATDAVEGATSDVAFSDLWQEFHKRQKNVAKLTIPEISRTLAQNSKVGVLSFLSLDKASEGFPAGSVVNYVADEDGLPVFCFSDLSAHTHGLKKDSRASLLIPEAEILSMQQPRVTLTGNVELFETENEKFREAFLKKHPNAAYIDFGDFHWFKMRTIVKAHFSAPATNVARAGTATGDEFLNAVPDPVAPFQGFICGHMNADHTEANKKIVEVMTGFDVNTAEMKRVDKFGVDFICTRSNSQPFICRVPFSSPALERKDVKERIVELTQQASEKRTAMQGAQNA